MSSLVWINSLERSGGSLLARLLEGHPNLASYPIERRFSRSKYKWPVWDHLLETRNFRGLCKAIGIDRNIERAARLPFLRKGGDKVPFRFSFNRFLARFHQLLDTIEDGKWSERRVFDAQHRAFFEVWENGKFFHDETKYVVNHLSRSFAIPVDLFFNVYPDGYILHVIRDPRGFYASLRSMPGLAVNEEDREYLDTMIARWEEATWLAIRNQARLHQRCFVVRFEDLISDTESVMRSICQFIGVKFETIVLTPTLAGEPWSGNSSFGETAGAIQTDRATLWGRKLSREEVRRIEDRLGGLMRLLSYELVYRNLSTRDYLLEVFPFNGNNTNSYLKEESDLLRTENERLADIVRKRRPKRASRFSTLISRLQRYKVF